MIPLQIRNYFREVNYILGKDRNRIVWLVPLFLLSSILDLLGISLVATFVTILVNRNGFSGNFFAVYFERVNFMVNDKLDLAVFICSSFIVVAFLAKTITAIIVNKKIFQLVFEQTVRLRSYLMKAYQGMDYIDYLQRNSSEYVYNIQTVVGQFSVSITQSILRIISESVICLVIIGFLAISDWRSLIVLLVLLGAVIFCYDRFFKNKIKHYGTMANKSSARLVKAIQEGMNGFRENRIYGISNYFNDKVSENAKDLADTRIKSQVITTSSSYVVEFVIILFVVLLVLISFYAGRTVDAIIGTIATFFIGAMRIMPSANQILSCATKIRYGKNTVDILYEDLKLIDRERSGRSRGGCSTVDKNTEKNSFQALKLKDVEFFYPGNTAPTLDHVNMEINRGESVGIIGKSGSGKTTLIDVVLGLLEPQKGDIRFDHISANDDVCKWTSEFAYLPQDVFIIDDTIRNNVALGIPSKDIDDGKVIEALRQSRLEDFVKGMPDGIYSVVGERGMRLSGGQRQRVAIARAFYHRRSILVMDESTSALDDQTENEVVEEISHLKGTVTTIVIAHRVTTLKHCDTIYEINKGHITKKGDYKTIVG